jgi:tetratricopeptide (TPR) repeat protein
VAAKDAVQQAEKILAGMQPLLAEDEWQAFRDDLNRVQAQLPTLEASIQQQLATIGQAIAACLQRGDGALVQGVSVLHPPAPGLPSIPDAVARYQTARVAVQEAQATLRVVSTVVGSPAFAGLEQPVHLSEQVEEVERLGERLAELQAEIRQKLAELMNQAEPLLAQAMPEGLDALEQHRASLITVQEALQRAFEALRDAELEGVDLTAVQQLVEQITIRLAEVQEHGVALVGKLPINEALQRLGTLWEQAQQGSELRTSLLRQARALFTRSVQRAEKALGDASRLLGQDPQAVLSSKRGMAARAVGDAEAAYQWLENRAHREATQTHRPRLQAIQQQLGELEIAIQGYLANTVQEAEGLLGQPIPEVLPALHTHLEALRRVHGQLEATHPAVGEILQEADLERFERVRQQLRERIDTAQQREQAVAAEVKRLAEALSNLLDQATQTIETAGNFSGGIQTVQQALSLLTEAQASLRAALERVTAIQRLVSEEDELRSLDLALKIIASLKKN